MIALESTFMFCSSMVVFIYITSGGVVGPDIRKMIRFKDLIFGAFLFFLLSSYYTYKFTVLPEEQRNAYDSHIVHLVGNMLMLESLLHNRSAMAYWRQIARRWLTNLGPWCRGAKVGALVAPHTLGPTALWEYLIGSCVLKKKIVPKVLETFRKHSRLALVFYISVPSNMVRLERYLKAPQSIILLSFIFFWDTL